MILAIEVDSISSNPKILTIGAMQAGETKLWKFWDYDDEEKMVWDFTYWFLREADKVIIGFNHLKFDLPILLLKAKEFGDFEHFFKKINQANVEDLFTLLTFMNHGKIKGLKEHCKDFNVSWPQVLDLDPQKLYEEGKHEVVEDHAKARIMAINDLKKEAWKRYNR